MIRILLIQLIIVLIAQGQAMGAGNTGDASEGAQIFNRRCAPCHGVKGEGTNVGPSLRIATNPQMVETMVREGKGIMPSFSNQLSKEQIQSVAEYVSRKLAGGQGGDPSPNSPHK